MRRFDDLVGITYRDVLTNVADAATEDAIIAFDDGLVILSEPS